MFSFCFIDDRALKQVNCVRSDAEATKTGRDVQNAVLSQLNTWNWGSQLDDFNPQVCLLQQGPEQKSCGNHEAI